MNNLKKNSSSGPLPGPPGAWEILRASIKSVPAVKYALGVAGILAALALGTASFSNKRAALVGAVIMLGLMVLLLIFSVAAKLVPKLLQRPALVLVWFALLAFCLGSSLSLASVFFDWPKPFGSLMDPLSKSPEREQAKSIVSVCAGTVVDAETGDNVEDALVALRTGERQLATDKSDSLGKFSLALPGPAPSALHLNIAKPGYKSRDFLLRPQFVCGTYSLEAQGRNP